MREKNNSKNKMISARTIMSRHNITYQTVNHYTDFGLLPVLVKKGNVRFYSDTLVKKRMAKIRKLMNEGYSLRLIRKKMIGI